MAAIKSRKFPKKKESKQPRAQIEILDQKEPPFDMNKQGQYSDYWKGYARAAKEFPRMP